MFIKCGMLSLTNATIWKQHGPLAKYVKLGVAHAPGMPGAFSPPSRSVAIPACVTHVPWCMPGSLTSGFFWTWWRGKRSRHSWRMRNPQFYVSGKRSIELRYLCWELVGWELIMTHNCDWLDKLQLNHPMVCHCCWPRSSATLMGYHIFRAYPCDIHFRPLFDIQRNVACRRHITIFIW